MDDVAVDARVGELRRRLVEKVGLVRRKRLSAGVVEPCDEGFDERLADLGARRLDRWQLLRVDRRCLERRLRSLLSTKAQQHRTGEQPRQIVTARDPLDGRTSRRGITARSSVYIAERKSLVSFGTRSKTSRSDSTIAFANSKSSSVVSSSSRRLVAAHSAESERQTESVSHRCVSRAP